MRPYPIDHPVAQRITRFIAEMMALDCQPFSIVEDQGFVRLLNHLQPRYQLPYHKNIGIGIGIGISCSHCTQYQKYRQKSVSVHL